jgi:hypothetical protein
MMVTTVTILATSGIYNMIIWITKSCSCKCSHKCHILVLCKKSFKGPMILIGTTLGITFFLHAYKANKLR